MKCENCKHWKNQNEPKTKWKLIAKYNGLSVGACTKLMDNVLTTQKEFSTKIIGKNTTLNINFIPLDHIIYTIENFGCNLFETK